MKKFLLILCTILHSALVYGETQELNIGILSERSKTQTLKNWADTEEYLETHLMNYHVTLVPLTYNEIEENIRMKRINFLLTDPALYIDLSYRFDISPIASIVDMRAQNGTVDFGGLLFVKSDRKDLNYLDDLGSSSLAALDERSLGGWLALQRELESLNKNRTSFSKSLSFTQSYDEIVLGVQKGIYDGGIIRSGVLESMSAEGLINQDDFKLISLIKSIYQEDNRDYPYLVSTRLYPQWPMVKLAHTSQAMAEEVTFLLLTMPGENIQWTTPLNYQEVHDCFFELRLGPYEKASSIDIFDVITEYLLAIIITLLTIFFLLTIVFYILHLNRLLKVRENELKNLISHDPLTGLPNRRMFQDYSERTLELCRRRGCRMALYFLNLDDLKKINNEHGYDVGDALLKDLGQRLLKQMRKSDLCARLGGDEFVSLIQDVKYDKGFDKVAKRIIEELSRPYFINETKLEVTISMGISFFPEQGGDLQELLNKAHKALELAKETGRGRYRIYSD